MIVSDSPPGVRLGVVVEVAAGVVGRGEAVDRLPTSIWGPKLTHDPNDNTHTCNPDRPSRR